MSELMAAILGVIGTLLAVLISYALGQRAERKKQSLLARSEMLRPIEDWLKGAEKMVGILGDTVSAAGMNLPAPINYDPEERRQAFNFLSENTNIVIGILDSKSLQTHQTKKLAAELEISILTLEQTIKYHLLPIESEIVEKAYAETLTGDLFKRAGELKLKIDTELQTAHMLIAKIKTYLA